MLATLRRRHYRPEWLDPSELFERFGYSPDHWRASGSGWVLLGLCPFHDDHDASLYGCLRGPDAGRLKCHACGWFGDGVQYMMDRYGLEFAAAAQYLGAWDDR